jgi:putative ABC transport system permease protein
MGIFQDFKFGFRMLLKNPGFTLVAVITIALGIGINSTVFTLTNAVLLKGLPFERPEQILHIASSDPAHGRLRFGVSYKDYADLRDQMKSFSGLAIFSSTAIDLSDDAGSAERVSGARVSANLFPLLGQKPFQGRDFTAGEDEVSAEPVALIGYGLWQTRYGGKDVIGKTVKANQKFYTIVGIMPQGMRFPNNEDFWIPLTPSEAELKRDARGQNVIGRLKPGVTPQAGLSELQAIAKNLTAAYPETNKDIQFIVQASSAYYNGPQIRTVFLAMQGAVTFVLLIVCANVANLLLARAVRRTRESSIRTALGANRWRIVRQFLIESVLMSFAGGLLGLGLSVAGVRMFDAAVQNVGKPYWILFTFDYHVALFFFGACVLTGLLFGLAPALQISRANVAENLKEGGRGSSGGTRARRLTGTLLIGEIGLTIVLLVGAGLMIRSFMNAQYFDLGIRSDNLLVARVAARGPKYPEPSNLLSFEERLTERLARIQGVEALTVASNPPSGGSGGRPLQLDDQNLADANNRFPNVNVLTIAPGYFQALGTSIIRGREFTSVDGAPGAEVAIVNESFIRKYWPDVDPIEKHIRLSDKNDAPWIRIVGVSPRILQSPAGPGQQNEMYPPLVYIPFRQGPTAGFNVIARSSMPREKLTAELRAGLQDVDPDLPLFNIAGMDDLIAQRSWPFRVFGTLFLTFALLALLMSSVGIYGVTSYGITQRTQEIGVRMALGASTKQVMWMVLRQGLIRIGLGLGIGLIAAWAMSRVLAVLLFQVTATDPVTFTSISLLLAFVTVIACFVPARRAMSTDPAVALRRE